LEKYLPELLVAGPIISISDPLIAKYIKISEFLRVSRLHHTFCGGYTELLEYEIEKIVNQMNPSLSLAEQVKPLIEVIKFHGTWHADLDPSIEIWIAPTVISLVKQHYLQKVGESLPVLRANNAKDFLVILNFLTKSFSDNPNLFDVICRNTFNDEAGGFFYRNLLSSDEGLRLYQALPEIPLPTVDHSSVSYWPFFRI
jgi:hypothetical protein